MTAFFQFSVVRIPRNYKATQFPKTCAYNLGKAKSFGTSQSALPRTVTLFLNWSKRFYELSNVLTLWTTHKPESVPPCSLCCCGHPHTPPRFVFAASALQPLLQPLISAAQFTYRNAWSKSQAGLQFIFKKILVFSASCNLQLPGNMTKRCFPQITEVTTWDRYKISPGF